MANTSTHYPERPDAHHEGGDGHPRFLAHHFGSPQQQFDAGKFGMWLFLITEVLFFSGLFCAYAVYRSTHPQAFANADQYLDPMLGATNTAVLILSSLTMAWAVRASQLGQRELLVKLLAITLACASIFLGVKAVEYSHKWDMGILWASQFRPTAHHAEHSPALLMLSIPAILAAVITAIAFAVAKSRRAVIATPFWMLMFLVSIAFFGGIGIGQGVPMIEQAITGVSHDAPADGHAVSVDHHASSADEYKASTAEHGSHDSAAVTEAVADEHVALDSHGHGDAVEHLAGEQAEFDPVYTGIFFSIYYVMTGLHAVHILAGMGVIAWLLWRSLRGDFGPDYFGPVDYVGLYWHLVDLIWIYLFPLLYLIG